MVSGLSRREADGAAVALDEHERPGPFGRRQSYRRRSVHHRDERPPDIHEAPDGGRRPG